MKRILYLLLACFFLAASIAYAADIRWRNSKTALDSISGLQSGDRGIVIGDNGTSQFYRYDGSKWVETPVANAENWATARLIAGNSVNGSANVPFANKFIVQGTSDAGLTGAQFLGALGTGLLKNTTTTGILSIAAAKTDYAPATSGSGILKGDGSGGFAAAAYGDVVGLWTDCTGYLNSDGTCSSPSLSESDPVVAAITGIVKSNGTTISKATAGTDYAPVTSGTGILKGDGEGGFDNATYTDVVGLWTTCTGYLKHDGTCDTPAGGGDNETLVNRLVDADHADNNATNSETRSDQSVTPASLAYWSQNALTTRLMAWLADGTITSIVVGDGNFTVDASGNVTAKSYSTTRGDAAQYIELYEATSDGDSKATIAVPAKGTGLAGDVSITVSQSLALTGTMTDGKYCTYASSGNVISCNSTPSDVDSVGDCTSGACLDGTSDGGGYIALYDGDSNKVTVDVANIDADATLLLGKTYTDGKWCTYSTTTGFNCNEDAPAGAGDVTKVGDCTDGDCYDGSSDGGTYWSLYDGTSSYLKGLAGVRTLTLSSGVADSEDLTVTLGSNDNTVSLSSSTGAVNLSANAFTISSNGLVPDAADGATLGSATAEWSDLFLADGAVINLGADQDVQLTHVADTGVLLGDGDGTATTQLQLGDSGTYINQPADGYIGLTGDTGVRLKADDEDLQLTKTGANGITLGTSTDVTTLTTALNFASTGNISGKIPMISKSANYTLGTDSAQEAYGYMVWLDGNATTLTLPAVAAGMSVCAYSADATVKYVDPNGSDGIRNGATRDTDGDAIKSAAALGDFVCLVGDGADGWTVLGKSGTWASQ